MTYEVFSPAPPEFVEDLVLQLSSADRTEIAVLAGREPVAAMKDVVQNSCYSFAYRVAGAPVCMGGLVMDQDDGRGRVWMVASTPRLERVKKDFLRCSRIELTEMRLLSPLGLRSYVDRRWRKSLRWLKWLGFAEAGEVEYKGRYAAILELPAYDAPCEHPFVVRLDGTPYQGSPVAPPA